MRVLHIGNSTRLSVLLALSKSMGMERILHLNMDPFSAVADHVLSSITCNMKNDPLYDCFAEVIQSINNFVSYTSISKNNGSEKKDKHRLNVTLHCYSRDTNLLKS